MKRLLALLFVITLCVPLWPAVSAEDAQPYQPIQYGDQGDNVTLIQQRLSELGYYTGKVSGNFLDGTRAAVKRFQKDYGLEETGVVDGETEALLLSAEYRVISTGTDGEDVTRLQQHLKDLGYFDQKPTGKFRAITEKSVSAFQANNGLTATGIADVETQRVLYSGKALAKGAKPTPTPDPSRDLGDINDMVIAGDGEDVEDVEYVGRINRGEKGENVKKVQTRLTELGFFNGPISGNYMDQTIAAMKEFQNYNGLRVTGYADEDTWNQLFNSQDVVNIHATPRPTPVPTPVPYAITVDVKNQVTTVYGRDDRGEYTIPVKQMVCSTGTVATPSTVGEFVLPGRRARWCYFPAWESHAQYWTKINEYIAFHSVTYHEVDYDALSTKSYNMLGSRASHGCVRLLVSDAKWIYDNIGEGIVVTVTEDLPLDEELRRAVAAPPLNKAKNGPAATPEPTPAPNYTSDGMPPQPFRQLKKGSTGEDVYWLQMKLKELGYYTGTVTGGYYSGTVKAVEAFQKDNGISATGKASVKTQEVLFADVLNPATPEPTAAPEVTPEPTPAATPQPAEMKPAQ
ncbi:MAG: peptidoglycan-binding protein [Clostridia bacterium]|nr:peptidoglycan-binding protein [Clostridia bacterium]